jgi:acetylornithine deacetylase
LEQKNIATFRKGNNVWVKNQSFTKGLPTILLNSHHDTVKPSSAYTNNPFEAFEKKGKLFGLGSNDAGAALVSLMATFLYFCPKKDLRYNLIFAATAEEEISGLNGVASILNEFEDIDFAIVGEPTGMNLAIAEKGLLVLDCVVYGTASHAAHNNTDNAIINSLKDIEWFNSFKFPKKSNLLGEVKMSVTEIKSGTHHNVIPDKCVFTVDIRTTDVYNNEEIYDIVSKNVHCETCARSFRLKSSTIDIEHPFVQAGISLGKSIYGSPTISDMALMHFPTVKIGPGDSTRSHSSDEFVFIDEIIEGIELYIKMLLKII